MCRQILSTAAGYLAILNRARRQHWNHRGRKEMNTAATQNLLSTPFVWCKWIPYDDHKFASEEMIIAVRLGLPFPGSTKMNNLISPFCFAIEFYCSRFVFYPPCVGTKIFSTAICETDLFYFLHVEHCRGVVHIECHEIVCLTTT